MLAAGPARWPLSPGDQRVDVWGWMVLSITSQSDTSTAAEHRNKGPLENYLQSLKPLCVSAGVCLILCMPLTSLSTSACRASMKTCLFASRSWHCYLKNRELVSVPSKKA